MSRFLVTMLVAGLALGACGGDDDDAEGETGSGEETSVADSSSTDDDGGGAVLDAAPAGEGTASVDGLDISFVTDVSNGNCLISDESITFGFAAADGVTTMAGGMNRSSGQWAGSILIRVPNPDGEGFIQYYPATVEGGTLQGSIGVDGSSMVYSGPIEMQPVNDGSNPPPVDVGDGTISATC